MNRDRHGSVSGATEAGARALPDARSRRLEWLTILVFAASSSIFFALFFEYDRYFIAMGRTGSEAALGDHFLILWLLVAKSFLLLLPVLLVCRILNLRARPGTSSFVLVVCWIAVFFFMAADLICVGFAGHHLSGYMGHVADMFFRPGRNILQWAGERLITEALTILAIVAVLGVVWFLVVTQAVRRLGGLSDRLCRPATLAVLTLAFPATAVVVIPALQYFHHHPALERCCDTLPITVMVPERIDRLGPGSVAYAAAATMSPALLRQEASRDVAGADRTAENYARADLSSLGVLDRGRLDAFAELKVPELLAESADPHPEDSSAVVRRPNLPNVLLIIFESFRPSAVSPQLMKDLDAWSTKGLRLDRHYSGSNCSHLGLFSLLYGRSPLGYHETLNRKVRPQMLQSLRGSGYRISFLTSGETNGFRRVDEFINDRHCHEVVSDGRFSLNAMDDWPKSDLWKLEKAREILTAPSRQPQFVFFYLVSTHYRYAFPPEYERFKEVPSFWHFLHPQSQARNLMNRYANASLFLDEKVDGLFRSLDLKRNLVMVTGDHGESMGEDGVFTHGTRMSESQTRVPFFMLGAGVEPRRIPTATIHTDITPTLLHALAGKPVQISRSHGRDLIADPSPADQVLLVPANGPHWEGFLVVQGDKRAAFRTRSDGKEPPSFEFAGLVDETGQFEFRAAPVGPVSRETSTGR